MKKKFPEKGIRFRIPNLVLFCTLLFTLNLNAQTWQIFTPEYSFNGGKVNLSKVIKTRLIVDVTKGSDGTIWLACGDSYPLNIRNLGNYNSSDYDIVMADPAKMKEMNYVPSPSSCFASLPGGEIWLATQQNLLRLSPGGSWVGINVKSKSVQPGIPVPDFDLLSSICKDNDGNLWISGVITEKKTCGIAKLDGNKWTYFMMPNDVITKILAKNSGKGFKVLSGKEMVYDKTEILRLIIKNFCFDRKGNGWMSMGEYNDEGMFEFINGQFRYFSVADGNISSDDIYDIETDRDDNLYAATSKGLFVISNEGKFVPFNEEYAAEKIISDGNYLWWSGMIRDPKNTKTSRITLISQTSTDATVIRRYNKTDKSTFTFTTDNTPLKTNVTQLYIDENGIKYFIVNNPATGLYILNDNPEKFSGWKNLSEYKDGSESMIYHAITAGYNDKDWNFTGVSNDADIKSLVEFRDGKMTHTEFKMADEPTGIFSSSLSATALAKDNNNNLYMGTSNFLYKYDKLANLVGNEKPKSSKQIQCMTSDQEGKIWIGTIKGLANYDGSKFTYFDKSNSSVPGNNISALFCDSKNRVWAGTQNGLLCIDKDKQTVFDKKSGLSNERIVALAENSKGTVYAASVDFQGYCKALNYEENGQMKKEELPDMVAVNEMAIDRKDNLWISGPGLLMCRKNTGEYVVYNKDNSPIKPANELDKLFIVGNEIWLVVYELPEGIMDRGSSGSKPAPGAPAESKETQILNVLKPKVSGLSSWYSTLVFQPE